MSDSSSTDHISADFPGIHGTSHEFADLTDAEIFNAHQGGKIATTSRLNLETIRDLSIAYTPGVARVCEAIHEDPSLAHHYTWAGRNVAIITDGTAVLGLGDIGPQAALPVMEGKAQLFQRFVVSTVSRSSWTPPMWTKCLTPSAASHPLSAQSTWRIFPRLGALSWRSG